MHKEITKEYFTCSTCGANKFTKRYEFSVSFRKVNFTDSLVYNKGTDEFFVCANCEHTISAEDIRIGLREIKQKRKAIDRDNEDGI